MPNERSRQLQDLARRVADALPLEVAEEVVLTGSVSRGVADEISDIEMLIVTPEPMELAACFEHARAAGLEELDTWGDQSTPTRRACAGADRGRRSDVGRLYACGIANSRPPG